MEHETHTTTPHVITEEAAATLKGAAAVAAVKPQLDKLGIEAGAIEVRSALEQDPGATFFKQETNSAVINDTAAAATNVAAAASSGAAAAASPPGLEQHSAHISSITEPLGYLYFTVRCLDTSYKATQAQLDRTTVTTQRTSDSTSH